MPHSEPLVMDEDAPEEMEMDISPQEKTTEEGDNADATTITKSEMTQNQLDALFADDSDEEFQSSNINITDSSQAPASPM